MISSLTATPLVRIHDVHKAFGSVKVLRGMSLAVASGQAVCVIGPSGSGKSTLLRCINGLIPVDRGEVFVGEHAVHTLKSDHDMIALRKDVSIVFQQYNLFFGAVDEVRRQVSAIELQALDDLEFADQASAILD